MNIHLKKIFPVLIFLFMLSSILCLPVAATPFSDKMKQDALNDAMADCFTQIFEQSAGIPASGLSQMSGYFAEGDYGSALLKAAEIGGSAVIDLIPGMGTVKFAASLEKAVIKLGKACLDAEMVDKFWKIFQDLSEEDQKKFVRGEYIAEIEAALGGYYTQRNVENLRDLFGYYLEQKKKDQFYMENAGKILKDLKEAETLSSPEPYAPENGYQISYGEFNPSLSLEWYTLHGNIFMVELLIGGQSYSVLKKLPPESIHAFYTVPLDEFEVDWDAVLNNAQGSLNLQWRVTSARYDTTGLVKIFAGETYVSNVYDIITLPGKAFTKTSSWQDITIIKDYQLNVSIEYPGDGLKTCADSVKVTAGITSPYGIVTDDIQIAAIAVNDTIEVAEISEDGFTIDAPLEMGNNILLAGVMTTAGDYVISSPVTVTRTDHAPAWVLREIVSSDKCAGFDYPCYDVRYVMSEGFFSQQGNGKRGGPCYCERSGKCGPWNGSSSYTVPESVLFPEEEIPFSVELDADEGYGYHVGMGYCVYSDAEEMAFDERGYNTGNQPSYCTDSGMPEIWGSTVIPDGSMTIPSRPGGGLIIKASFGYQCTTGYIYVYEWTENYSEPREVKTYYDSGSLKSVNTWRDGQKNGPVIRYYENGIVSARATYLNGVPQGSASYYYEDGTPEKTANYVNGKSNGPTYYYDENGNLHTMIMYVDGVKEGLSQEYYADGSLWKEYTYVDGILNDPVTEYNPDGSIKGE